MPVLNTKQEGIARRGYVRPATAADCVYIADNMRADDLMEIKAGCHPDPLLCVMDCYERTEKPYVGMWDDQPCCIFGATRLKYRMYDAQGNWCPKGLGAPWMLGTDRITDARWVFLMESRKWLNEVKGDYDHLWNRVHSKNQVHIRWLRWLGFEFGDSVVYPTGEVFLDFNMRVI